MLLENNKIKHATLDACLDHICNEGHTPYLAVDTTNKGYMGPFAPQGGNGIVILSISASAVVGFYMDDDGIEFGYSQGGTKAHATIPMGSIVAITAKEDETLFQPFPYDKVDSTPQSVKVTPKPVRKAFKPVLIKGGKT